MADVTLRDILDLTWTVTVIDVDVRQPDGSLIKSYIIGEGKGEESATVHQRHDIEDGKLVMMDRDINHHGRRTRGGSEIGWGSDFKAIPKELLDMKVTHFFQSPRNANQGSTLYATLEQRGQLSMI